MINKQEFPFRSQIKKYRDGAALIIKKKRMQVPSQIRILEKAFELVCKRHTETVAKYYGRGEFPLSVTKREWLKYAEKMLKIQGE